MKLVLGFHMMVMNYLCGVVGSGSPEEIMGRFKDLKVSDPSKFNTTRSLFRNMSRDVFGTWMPTIKFHSSPAAISSVTGVMATVVQLRASSLAYFNSFSGLFDEYRMKGPIEAVYRPTYVPNVNGPNHGFGVGAVDFVDSTAMASTAGALMYDTAEIFPTTLPNSGTNITTWHTKLLGQPDLLWIDTGVQSTDFCWFKVYNWANNGGSVTWGYHEWIAEVEFRQLYGI